MTKITKSMIPAFGALSLLLLAVPALAGDPAMPGVERRQQIQQGRIRQGVASGELTPRETIRLERQQAGVERAQRRAKADGVVTPGEHARLHARQDKSSRDIFRAKHNDRKVR